jgi:hypothetical protein
MSGPAVAVALFPLTVLLLTAAVPWFSIPPPHPAPKAPLTLLPVTVLLVTLSVGIPV